MFILEYLNNKGLISIQNNPQLCWRRSASELQSQILSKTLNLLLSNQRGLTSPFTVNKHEKERKCSETHCGRSGTPRILFHARGTDGFQGL